MNELITKVLQWGVQKGITGANGTGTPKAQATKMLEEAQETINAVFDYHNFIEVDTDHVEVIKAYDEIKDGIGDTCVTLILLAELHNWTLEECLQHAYDVISKRTGQMVDGTFVKDPDDDLNEPLGQACQLGDETCESCQ